MQISEGKLKTKGFFFCFAVFVLRVSLAVSGLNRVPKQLVYFLTGACSDGSAAILFESGASREMDLSVLVYAPEELRIVRVMERDQAKREAVLKRMQHQMSDEEKMKIADHIIYNDETQMLLPQVIELHKKVLNSID